MFNLNFVPALTGKLIVHEGVNEYARNIFDNVNFDVELILNESNLYKIDLLTNESKRRITKITFQDGVEEIPQKYMEYSNIKSVIIPDSVAKIGYHAFYRTALTYVELPKNVKFLDSRNKETDEYYNSFSNGYGEKIEVRYREN